jgi:predicted O-linked N-acetylglucosamine transferase (SPINDLY family)
MRNTKRRTKMSSKNEAVDLTGLDSAAEKRIPVPPAALTPEMQCYMNASLSAALKEALAGLAPILQSIALTPEKIELMESARRAPTPDQAAAAARNKREKALALEEADQNRKNLKLSQENCLHRYVSGALSVSAIRNYPDRQSRFVCHRCMAIFQPRHWEILAPTAEFPRGVEKIVDADPLYVQIAKEWHTAHES